MNRRCCDVGFCPLCGGTGVRPTMRSILAHRAAFQHLCGADQSRPISSDTVSRAPTKRLGPDEITGGESNYGINSVFHAPEASGALLANVSEPQSTLSENE